MADNEIINKQIASLEEQLENSKTMYIKIQGAIEALTQTKDLLKEKTTKKDKK